MPKRSAGLLMYRISGDDLEVLLVHPGGPFWTKKDAGAWFLPKGEIDPGEDALAAARREFQEETGLQAEGTLVPLGTVRHKGGKLVHAWALEGDCDPSEIRSNTFSLEWPPRSGRRQEFSEVDRAQFFSLDRAKEMIFPEEAEFLLRLEAHCIEAGKLQR